MSVQRQVILREIKKLNSHPTALELYFIVKKILPNIGLGTVYRNLNFLAEKGEITKIEAAGSQKRFDGNVGRHNHFRCKRCDRVYDLPSEDILSAIKEYKHEHEHDILGYNLEFYGICKNCWGQAET